MDYGIIVVAYNRVKSVRRLLDSLKHVEYFGEKVDLIVSIDNSGNTDVEDYVKNFNWTYGEIIIRTFEQRQGLKNHILSCGAYLEKYDAIAVFEDDVIVSPAFYSFMRETVPFYYSDNRIAGISLFSHQINVNVKYPFVPEKTRFDVYFMQFAQSWGQIWMKDSFLKFINWVEQGDYSFDFNTPDYVNSWPDKSSWLKLHIKYCVDNNLFFVYPYYSFTTCFSDPGEHVDLKNTLQQVPLVIDAKARNFSLTKLTDESVCYDVFFERILNDKNVLMDIYGSKTKLYIKHKFILSTNHLNFKIVNSYALDMKPHERNYIDTVFGKELFLYDTTKKEKNHFVNNVALTRFDYFYSFAQKHNTIPSVFVAFLIAKIKSKFSH